MNENTQLSDEDVYAAIKAILKTWSKMADWLRSVLCIMGILAIACSIFIGTFTEIGHLQIKILAAGSTLFLTIISAFSLPAKANNVRNAWRHLNKAIYNYQCKAIDIKDLIKAYEEGEIMVGDVNFTYDKPQFNKS